MTRLAKHIDKWREDVRNDIRALTEELDELHGVLAWLDEQAGEGTVGVDIAPPMPAPVPPEPEAAPPESESEAPPEPTEAPAPSDDDGQGEPAAVPKAGGRWGTYTRVTLAQVRDCVRTRGPSTAREVADALGCSDGNVRPKLQKWVENGTMETDRITTGKTTVTIYRMKGVEHSPLRAQRRKDPASLRLVGGVAGTGKRNVKVMKRKGAIKGVKGQ